MRKDVLVLISTNIPSVDAKMGALLTRKEAADRLGMSIVTLDLERDIGCLAYIQRRPRGKVWIPESAIAEYLEKALHPVKSTPTMMGNTYRKRRA